MSDDTVIPFPILPRLHVVKPAAPKTSLFQLFRTARVNDDEARASARSAAIVKYSSLHVRWVSDAVDDVGKAWVRQQLQAALDAIGPDE